MELNKIYNRNVLDIPWQIPDNCIDCCVTSPPYWGLRDYNNADQIGLEKTPEEYVDKMVRVFNEVYRVLKPNGTLWLNMGDNYCSSGISGIKPKDMTGMPWMVAFALRTAGYYLRQDIIWAKPNPMPESAQDRCTKSHEYIFLLSKSSNYYYDAYSIATPYKDKTYTTFGIEHKGYGDGSGLIQSENWSKSMKERKPKQWKTPDGWDTGSGSHGSVHHSGREKGKYKEGIEYNGRANKRSVWTVATAPFKEAHFATFPEDLITPCILAGCPKDGIVLDPFMGAGTTALVAKLNDRNFIGLELNPEYIKIADDRLKDRFGMFHTSVIPD